MYLPPLGKSIHSRGGSSCGTGICSNPRFCKQHCNEAKSPLELLAAGLGTGATQEKISSRPAVNTCPACFTPLARTTAPQRVADLEWLPADPCIKAPSARLLHEQRRPPLLIICMICCLRGHNVVLSHRMLPQKPTSCRLHILHDVNWKEEFSDINACHRRKSPIHEITLQSVGRKSASLSVFVTSLLVWLNCRQQHGARCGFLLTDASELRRHDPLFQEQRRPPLLITCMIRHPRGQKWHPAIECFV